MSAVVRVAIHPSQFPDAVRRDLLDSLRRCAVQHKFHYEGDRQARKWLAVHEACSPARTRPDVAATYQRAFEQTAEWVGPGPLHVIGLGCGGGAKDCALMEQLEGRTRRYTPVDVSAALVVKAWQTAGRMIPPEHCSPLVCDLANAEDLPAVIREGAVPGETRLLTFLGMLPNFEPETILPRLAALVQPGDYLLCSANLAPGSDYRKGVEHVLPLYDNELTRDWLMTFLTELGVAKEDGAMTFRIEEHPGPLGLLRIAVYFRFAQEREVRVDGDAFGFRPADVLRLFFSYRHTPALVEDMLAPHGLGAAARWISPCAEEGLFLVQRATDIPGAS